MSFASPFISQQKLTTGSLIALCLLIVSCTPQTNQTEEGAIEQKVYNWKMVTAWPKNYPVLGTGAEKLAENIRLMSGNRLNIKVYGAGELVPALQTFDAVSSGSVEMGHAAAYYWKGRIPAVQFFTTIPFGMNFIEKSGWLYYGGALEKWKEIYAPFNIVPFAAGNTGAQWAGWFNKPIEKISDLQGILIRMSGLGGEILAMSGAQRVNMPGSDIFVSMETGVIDAAEWVGPANDASLGLDQIAKYYYTPGWQEPNASLELIVNQDAYNSLPEDLQHIIRVAAQASDLDVMAEYTAVNPQALKHMVDEKGVVPRILSDEILLELRRNTNIALQGVIEGDPQAQEVYESWKTFKDDSWEYRKIADYYLEGLKEIPEDK